MSDSSEDEDLSRFKEAVDSSFTKLIKESRNEPQDIDETSDVSKMKSERYLEVSSHYNDVKVPKALQQSIGAKVSKIIERNVEFVEFPPNTVKKRKIKGGVKLFSTSEDFLSCEEPQDTYTESHNQASRHVKVTKRTVENDHLAEDAKVKSSAVSGEYVLSKEETKLWKSRRKEKIFKYKKTKELGPAPTGS